MGGSFLATAWIREARSWVGSLVGLGANLRPRDSYKLVVTAGFKEGDVAGESRHALNLGRGLFGEKESFGAIETENRLAE